MRTMKGRLVGNRLRDITDCTLAVATLLALVGMIGYYKIRDTLWPASQDRV